MKILALDSSTSIASIAFLEYQSSSENRSLPELTAVDGVPGVSRAQRLSVQKALDDASTGAMTQCIESSELCTRFDKILFEYHRPQQRTNSSIFFEGLETALQKCGIPDRLVVGLGPGSYNGLRSSIAAAQGLASSCKIELIGLSSILGLEAGATECWVVGDARGGQYWLAALSYDQLLEKPFLLAPADLPNHLKRYPHFPLVASQELPLLPASINVTIQTPNATILARLGKDATPSASLEPLYLKPPHITMPRPNCLKLR